MELHGKHAATDAGRGDRRDEDGTQYYVLDYTARGATWFRHNVSVYAARCGSSAAAPMLSCFMRAVCLHRCSDVALKCMCLHSVFLQGAGLAKPGSERKSHAGRLARMAV